MIKRYDMENLQRLTLEEERESSALVTEGEEPTAQMKEVLLGFNLNTSSRKVRSYFISLSLSLSFLHDSL